MVLTSLEGREVTSWVEIDEQQIAKNFGLLRAVATEAAAGAEAPELLAVVKADAYGHGVRVCAPTLARAGASWLGVTDAAEGVVARGAMLEAGRPREMQPGVLVLCGMLQNDAALMVDHGLTPVIWTAEHVEWLAAAAGGHDAVSVHLEIDSGMCRQGVAVGAGLNAVLGALLAERRLKLEGVMTHIASSEVAGSVQTRHQHALFEAAVDQVRAAGMPVQWVHVGSTSTLDNDDRESFCEQDSLAWLQRVASGLGARAMIRTGLGLYGYCLPIEGVGVARLRGGLRPAMSWKTQVIGIRDVAAGDAVGYNATFVAERPMRLALLPVGYADGLRRELSGTNAQPGGWVMVQGRRCPIVGRVSMNLTVADVTGLAAVRVGDRVILLGDGVTADDHARLAHTIAYDIVCGVKAALRDGCCS